MYQQEVTSKSVHCEQIGLEKNIDVLSATNVGVDIFNQHIDWSNNNNQSFHFSNKPCRVTEFTQTN